MLELLIGQIPEAIYFALFLIFAQKMIQEVDSPEAKQIIRKHLRKISQMG